MIRASPCVLASVNSKEVNLKNSLHQTVSKFIVISILWRPIKDLLPQLFMSIVIGFQDFDKFTHRKCLAVKYMMLDTAHCIRHCAQTHTLNICGVITRTTVMVVLPL